MKPLEIWVKLPTDYNEEYLEHKIIEALGERNFSYYIECKSLDARNKENIHWDVRISIAPENSKKQHSLPRFAFEIPRHGDKKKAVVVGSGPAGFFSAYVLQKAGIQTTLIERGVEVDKRSKAIDRFEKTGVFNPAGNYAFGEGGAGAFSDGKLTSRSKHIASERAFIIESFIKAGAPNEIRYLAHPHLGSDNLRKIVKNLRKDFLNIGGVVLFETILQDIIVKNKKVVEAVLSSGGIEAEYFIVAPGNAAFDTCRLLMKRGVRFCTKNFAVGCRVEHPQDLINLAQWGRRNLIGVKAAEYRLASKGDGNLPVYTFCMCPGGRVIPSTAYGYTNIVNGMSFYKRNGKFANAACVAGVDLNKLAGKEKTAGEALDWLEALEGKFYRYSSGFQAPFCPIQNFIHKNESMMPVESSYPLKLKPAPLWELLPPAIGNAIREGLKDFSRKIKGFETGIIMGLESKTSSPIRVIREKNGLCAGFENLYVVGAGSGYAGGILSSGADGIKAAMSILSRM